MNSRTVVGAMIPLALVGAMLVAPDMPLSHVVSVTPDKEFVTQPANSGPFMSSFFVHNTGTFTDSYNLTCVGNTNVVCSNVDPTFLTLNPGVQVDINATYTTTSTLGYGQLIARATGAGNPAADSGYYRVQVVSSGTPTAPTISVADPLPDWSIDRGLCLTISLGDAAASECGDLRLVHMLPATRTLNKSRTPTLLYNSQHAHPAPIVAANVTLPAGASIPTQVSGRLWINGVLQPVRQWPGSSWSAGATRRVAIAGDGIDLPSGAYTYQIEMTNEYPTGPMTGISIVGELFVVNRKDSPFGAGWWVAGLERLDTASMIWTGGDGSLRRYTSAGSNVWAGPDLDRPDTLKFDGTHYVRFLPGGLRVKFRSDGRHVQTVNRLGHITPFEYDACSRLWKIKLPPDTTSRVYQFHYAAGDCTTKLDSVSAPPIGAVARTTRLTMTSGRIVTIQDPDLTTIQFAYGQGTSRVTSRTDRRNVVNTFAYDGANRVAQASLDMSPAPIILTGVRPLESVGFVSPVDTAWATSKLDGPRTDVSDTTIFWLDRYGQPRRIVNAKGYLTLLKRQSLNWPVLPTELVAANGLVRRATYDARGNILLDSVLDPLGDGRAAVARYEWDAAWDFVTKIVPPERDSLVLAYDGTTGNRLWQQDARGTPGRTEFFYYAGPDSVRGLVRSTRTPGQTLNGPRDSVLYDLQGNLRGVKTPIGFWAYSFKDAVGRDTLLVSPTDSAQTPNRRQQQRVVYTVADRDTLSVSIGPALPYQRYAAGLPSDSFFTAAETLWVRKRFDPEGSLDSLSRWATPNPAGLSVHTTRYHHDGAGRVNAEVAPDGQRDSTAYDPTGNVVAQVTRGGDTLTFVYDVLNRLEKRITRAKPYPYMGTAPTVWHFPMYREDASGELNTLNGGSGGNFGLTIPRDTAVFTYDSVGNILTADNRDARITRTYFRGGPLQTETQRLRTYVGADFTQHIYTLQYAYDLNLRRVSLTHPSQLLPAGASAPAVSHFNPIGQLDTLRDVFGSAYAFEYDPDGQLTQMTGARAEQFFYDADGRQIRRVDPLHTDTLRYDARGKVLRAGTMADSTHSRYAGLGAVAWSQTRRYEDLGTHPEEQYVTDAFGNATNVFRRVNGIQILEYPKETRYTYLAGSGRLAFHGITDSSTIGFYTDEVDSTYYDAAGNRTFLLRKMDTDFGGTPADLKEYTKNYYGPDGKLRVADRRTCLFRKNSATCEATWDPGFNERQAFEEYRYDALGRRVLLRTRGEWGCSGTGCRKLLQRFVWDGDQLLYEISAPGATGETAANMERDVGHPLSTNLYDHYFTGRVAYTHGLGLDQPLAVIRVEHSALFDTPFVVTPYTTWKGDYDSGTGAPCENVWQIGPGPGDSTLVEVCVVIDWPSPYLWLSKLSRQRAQGPTTWLGSLIEGQRDLTGQLYRRNRYYDPASGRFTQEDPLGLVGGLNLYGFAAGDPINFGDPFGLCPYTGEKRDTNVDDCPNDKLGNAFRLLKQHGGKEGAETIETIATKRMNINQQGGSALEKVCGKSNSGAVHNGCTKGTTITINEDYSSTDQATLLTHEATHIREKAPFAQEEVEAWNRALTVFDRLPAQSQSAYTVFSEWRQRDPAGFNRAVCTVAGGKNC